MRAITKGQRGSAVEDVQRRLLSLGYDLGPTGVDGMFADRTIAAVRAFRTSQGLEDIGVVDEVTWGALVDATFTMGDRSLFLKYPYFHGRDVQELQQALTVLGFAVSECDGIFGAYTESAVREFQINAGTHTDGIVGNDTFRCLERLKHVWEGKDPVSHSAAEGGFARAADALIDINLIIRAADDFADGVARRIANLAEATHEGASVYREDYVSVVPTHARIVAELFSESPEPEMPQVVLGDFATLPVRIKTAIDQQKEPAILAIDLSGIEERTDRSQQSAAVRLLDAFCTVSTQS